ncbi:MAG: PIN domain-containing protein [Deltaproteobacteria bacterium]|nr:PIN domain-containing protein [Deltaproteobacteria bacterium]
MKAFFDTNVYINTFFKAVLSREDFQKFFELYDIVVCPVVKHELLLGTIHPKTKKALERFFNECPVLEAPTREIWQEMTETMKKLRWKENRQQNDLLIALTAQKEEATLVTYDKHFETVQDWIEFELVLLRE